MEIIEKTEEPNLEQELLAPYRHLVRAQKKLLASNIFWSFNHWLNVPEDLFIRVKESVTMYFNGIIMLDDIQDNSLIRHGFPTAQCVYGMPLALNTGIQIIAESMKNVVDLIPHGLGGKLLAEEFHGTMVGQGTEIYWRENFICPTEEQYIKMLQQKTGSMIKLGVKLLQALSTNRTNYDKLVNLLGYYYQLHDDYSNLCAKEDMMSCLKCRPGFSGRGHRQTVVVVHAFRRRIPESLELFIYPIMDMQDEQAFKAILRKRTTDVSLKKYCLSLLEETGSLQYTRDRLSKLEQETRAEIARLGGNPQMEIVLKQLSI